MKRLVILLTIVSISLALMGCTKTYGPSLVKQAIITKNLPSVGMTKDELTSQLGQPTNPGGNTWQFDYHETTDASFNPHCKVSCPPSGKALIAGGIILPLLFDDCFYDDHWTIKVDFDESSKVEMCNASHVKRCRSGFMGLIEGTTNELENESFQMINKEEK
jgi:hypothetical protein